MHVEGCGGRVLVAGDVADGGEVAADRGHVREGRVSEVVGAEVLGFVFTRTAPEAVRRAGALRELLSSFR